MFDVERIFGAQNLSLYVLPKAQNKVAVPEV
jgi:hypothetical protein